MGKDDENALVSSFTEWMDKLRRRDCDNFDRLSNRYTIAMLVTCSLLLATKAYVGDSIDCYVPAEFKENDNWIKYVDNYCWIKNTYYVPNNERLPGPVGGAKNPEASGGIEILYYQWVPIIIAFMLLLFSVPVRFWAFSMWSSGYDIQRIIEMLTKDENVDPEKRDKTTEYIVSQLSKHIGHQRALGRTQKIRLGNAYGRYLFFMCLATKVLYTAVPISLLFILNYFMGPGYYDYGIRAMNGLWTNDGTYIDNPMFPRHAFCDFAIRSKGNNIHRYTAQCVLPVNLFNDKVFLLFWWWFLVLACLSFLGILVTLVRNCRPGGGVAYVEKYLHVMKVADPESESDSSDIRRFTEHFLSLDGVFCMRLIAMNTLDVVAGEIIAQLFVKWKDEQGAKYKDM